VLLGAGAFVFGGLLSSTGAQSPGGSIYNDVHALYVMVLWVWTGTMVLRTRGHILTVLTLWAASLAFDGIGAILQIFGPHVLVPSAHGHRATAFTTNPNDLGGATSVAIVPALLLATRWRPGELGIGRLLRWGAVGLIALALVLGASVSGMSGAVGGVLLWLAAPSVRASARTIVVVAAVAMLLIVSLAGGKASSPLQRIQLVSSNYSAQGNSGSGQDRLAIVRTVWPRILQDPVIGVGVDKPDTVVSIISNGSVAEYQVHGAPLAAWYEAGIFGLLGFLILIVTYVGLGWRSVIESATGEDGLIALSLLCAFIAFIVFAFTSPFLFQQYGWFSAVLLVAWRQREDAQWARAPAAASAGTAAVVPPAAGAPASA
jgi:O-antigen ligase